MGTMLMNAGELITLWTIRAALLCYGAVLCGWAQGELSPRQLRYARYLWTLGCVLFIVHMLAALHYYHHDSHAEAVAHTTEQTERVVGVRFSGGIYFNYLFAAVWLMDVLWWWLAPQQHAKRPAWQTWLIHGYLFFIAFNSTVVFADGPIRWLGVAFCLLLLVFALFRRQRSGRM